MTIPIAQLVLAETRQIDNFVELHLLVHMDARALSNHIEPRSWRVMMSDGTILEPIPSEPAFVGIQARTEGAVSLIVCWPGRVGSRLISKLEWNEGDSWHSVNGV